MGLEDLDVVGDNVISMIPARENNGENCTECFEMMNKYKNVLNSEAAQLLVYSLIGSKFRVL
jgi:hypothetical protein